MLNYMSSMLKNMPQDWVNLTTHRLDIYDEKLAKTQFLDQFENLVKNNDSSLEALNELPTAFDYIRLGHPLSCILEWLIANLHGQHADNVISFSSNVVPILAVLRKNLLEGKQTRLVHMGDLPANFDAEIIQKVYGYQFELIQVDELNDLAEFEGSTFFISEENNLCQFELSSQIDFFINIHDKLGSVLFVNGKHNSHYISEIQHVRRRETIAMTPANCLEALSTLLEQWSTTPPINIEEKKKAVLNTIQNITGSSCKAVVGSSGLSIQYAIVMGLIHHAIDTHPRKEIRIVVPPNCYGGTNDQARRVAACLKNVSVMDLPVDGDNDMVQSTELVLEQIAKDDAVPYIIAEIPTNPRVEVPDLDLLRDALAKTRYSGIGKPAVEPVFILDQTFCPNVHFLRNEDILSEIQTISYVSGSKFPSGGKCTAGYALSNNKANHLMDYIESHLLLCDNEATDLQYEILAKQMPSMTQRIHDAYLNTRDFVNFIMSSLPEANINFVSEELANQGFTPSVFSLDLPTKGNTAEEQEAYKRNLNLKLINLMINEIPHESKYCVSYGQLKGCYWTIPATSTQGTTKEGDKDYIVRVALAPDLDLDRHKKVFSEFVANI